MRFKSPILSRLFNPDPDESRMGPPVEGETAPTTQTPGSQPELIDLPLTPDHPLHQLWQLYSEQDEESPPLALHLEYPPDLCHLLPDKMLKQELDELGKTIIRTGKKRLADAVPKDNAAPPDLDASPEVFLGAGLLTAWLLIYPPVGKGKHVDPDMLKQALSGHNVAFGVDEELAERLPEDPRRYSHLFLIAKGSPPVNGTDGRIISLFPQETRPTADIDESGQIDYAELHLFHNVKKGDVICQIVQPTSGVPGRTVSGQEISAQDGKKAPVPRGRNTELSEDENALVASQDGRIEYNGRNFQVNPVLDINGNVDYSTGNINFLGDIHIRGDVYSNFIVRAAGNITVDGVVEGCSMEAGGSIIIRKGVKGDNKATIQACHDVYAKYLENSTVSTKENLQTDCMINCDIYTDGVVQATSGRGIIIGGRIRAASKVIANVVGARSECRTVISLGGVPTEDFEYESLQKEIRELEQEYEKFQQRPDTPSKYRGLPLVRMKLSVDRARLKQHTKLLENSQTEKEQEQEQEQEQDGRQLVCRMAYPGTEIVIGEAILRLDREVRSCTAALVEDQVRLV